MWFACAFPTVGMIAASLRGADRPANVRKESRGERGATTDEVASKAQQSRKRVEELLRLGQVQQAIVECQETVRICENGYGEQDAETLRALRDLGEMYFRAAELKRAQATFERIATLTQ